MKINSFSDDNKRDFYIGFAFFILGMFIMLYSYIILDNINLVSASLNHGVGSSFTPKIIALLILVLSIAQMIKTVKDNKNEKKNNIQVNDLASESISVSAEDKKEMGKRELFSIFMLILYCVMLIPFGFIIASIIYLFLQMIIMDQHGRKKKSIILYAGLAVIVSVVIYLIFVNGFSLMLPAGTVF